MECDAEIEQLMMVEKNILAPTNGRPCIGIVQDTLLAGRIMTMRDCFFNREEMMRMLCFLKTWDGVIPTPAILKPKPLWTGKQIFSCILPKLHYSQHCQDFTDTETKQNTEDISPSDSKMIIRDGELLCGHLCKKTVGPSHNSLIHIFLKDFGVKMNQEFMEDLQEMTRHVANIVGITVGNSDMPVEKDVRKRVKDALQVIKDHMLQWKQKKMPYDEYETRVHKLVNDARSNVAKDLMEKLPNNNNFKLILTAGSKGQQINPTQIMVCIGQNNVEGKRIPYVYTDRVSPHHKRFDDSPETRGFAWNCFMNGMTPVEYWNHTMESREGLIDTAVKTSETGYLQRRLTKAMEDLSVRYDGTVRTAQGLIVQFASGHDGFDPCYNEFHPYKPYKLTHEQFKEKYFWDSYQTDNPDCISLFEMEENRFENDWKLMEEYRNVYETFTTPVNFNRLLDNLPDKKSKNYITAEKVIDDVIRLQINLWKHVKQIEYIWDTKFAMLLRSCLASKIIVKKHRMTLENWEWLLKNIEKQFIKALAQPGDMVGSIAGQAIGEPSTQMSTIGSTEIIIFDEENKSVFSGPISELIDPLVERYGVDMGKGSLVVDTSRCGFKVVSVTEREECQWANVTELSRHPANGGLVRVSTRSGRTVTCTLSHSFLTRSEQQVVTPIRGSALRIGDYIPVIRKLPHIDPVHTLRFQNKLVFLDDNFGWFIGLYLATGKCIDEYSIQIAFKESTINNPLDVIIQRFDAYYKESVIESQFLTDLLNQFCGNHVKRIPCFGFTAPRSFTMGLLRGFFDNCGHFHSDHISCDSTFEFLIMGISWILTSIGIVGLLNSDEGRWTFRFKGSDNARIFLENVGSDVYERELRRISDSYIPGDLDEIPKIADIAKRCERRLNLPKQCRSKIPIARKKLEELLNLFKDVSEKREIDIEQDITYLKQAIYSDVIWDEIVTIDYLSDPCDWVYDISVEGTQTFSVANGILIHNTLNVFHFIGVSDKNIPMGVPRLKEIINNAKETKNSSMTIYLKETVRGNKTFVERFARQLVTRYFGKIVVSESIVYDPDVSQSVIPEDEKLVQQFSLIPDFLDLKDGIEWSQYVLRFVMNKERMIEDGITIDRVIKSLRSVYERTIHLEYSSEYCDSCIIRIRIAVEKKTQSKPSEDFYLLKELCKLIKRNVLVSKIDGIKKAFVKKKRGVSKEDEFFIETEGSNLRDVLADLYVDGGRTYTNVINEITQVLGIEATEMAQPREIQQVFKFYGIYVDVRHLYLLAAIMCNREKVMSITRHGMNRIDKGPLVKASFEETPEVLNEAARFAQKDKLKGVSEAIMVGKLAPIGTGTFSVFLDTEKIMKCTDVVPEQDLTPPDPLLRPIRKRIFNTNFTNLDDLFGEIQENYVMDDLDNHLISDSLSVMDYMDNQEWSPPSP